MNLKLLFKKSIERWWHAEPSSLGAALSFYISFSLTPLLSFGLVLFGRFFPINLLKDQIVATSNIYAGSGVTEIIQQLISNTDGVGKNVTAIIIGAIILFCGSLGVFHQLQLSLNRLWDVKPYGGILVFIKERTMAFALFIVLGIVLVASILATLAASVVLNFITKYFITIDLLFFIPAGQIIIFLATVLVINLIYRFLARVRFSTKARWLGSIGTALFFMIGEYILRFYLSSYSFSSTYGALGTLAVLLIWVYYSAQIFFFGAAWTYELDQSLKKST